MIDQLDRDLLGAFHDVRVGEHDSIRADDEAGALRVHGHLLLRIRHLPEELRQRIVAVVAERIAAERLADETFISPAVVMPTTAPRFCARWPDSSALCPSGIGGLVQSAVVAEAAVPAALITVSARAARSTAGAIQPVTAPTANTAAAAPAKILVGVLIVDLLKEMKHLR